MPQNPIGTFDVGRGVRTTLNVTALGTIVTPAVRVCELHVFVAGSGAPLVINDATTVLGATTPTEVWNVATAATATVNMPVASGGFVVSMLPAGARVAISYE